jgi:hypothetical protein
MLVLIGFLVSALMLLHFIGAARQSYDVNHRVSRGRREGFCDLFMNRDDDNRVFVNATSDQKELTSMISTNFKRLLCSSAVLLALATGAHAEVDAKKLTDAIAAQLAGNGMTLTIGSSEVSGTNVIVKDVSFIVPNSEPVKLGEVTLENVSEEGEGYLVGKISAPAFDKVDGDNAIKFGGASINNVHVAGVNETDPMKKLFLYEGIEMGTFKFDYKGKEAVSVEGAKFTMSPYKAGEALQFEGQFTGIHADFSVATDPKVIETFATLGYSEINGVISAKGSWNPTDGRIEMTETFDFKDVGLLNLVMDITGYTPKFVSDLQQMNKSLEGKDDSAKGLAFLGLIQQLTFNSVSLRFDDASLTGRVLDFTAKQGNQKREDVINQAKGVVPVLMMQLQDPEFAQKVSAAVSAYLDSPKNIEIKAAPATPLSFAVLAATATTSPLALIKQLGVSVTANQ